MLNVLPAQASSVPCECLFSSSKQIATDHHACLGSAIFEELVIMKSVWGPDLGDMAVGNGMGLGNPAQVTGISTAKYGYRLQ
jgi:hypothetical protein